MTEVTRIVTVEITGIVRGDEILPKKKTAELITKGILEKFEDLAGVVVTKIRDFEMEVGDD